MTEPKNGGDAVPSRHPAWLRVRMPGIGLHDDTAAVLRSHGLATVCEEAHCPNIGECYGHGTATFIVLGAECTRRCTFCAVAQADCPPAPPDPTEPERLAGAVHALRLRHAVVTSVTRDDLPDGGAAHFAQCAHALRERCPATTIEMLIPDLGGDEAALRTIVDSPVDVLAHNVETVPRLYMSVRPQSDYARSLLLLAAAGRMRPDLLTKSGLMLGLGEEDDEVVPVLRDLRAVGCRIVTLGQYLQPSNGKHPVVRYVPPGEFDDWRRRARAMGFAHVESGPLVRSSYHAWSQSAACLGAGGRESPK